MNDAAVSAADPIAQLLRATWPDPDGGPPIGVPIDAVVIEKSLRGAEADLVASLRFAGHIAVVSANPSARRFTFLDLAGDAGCLDLALA